MENYVDNIEELIGNEAYLGKGATLSVSLRTSLIKLRAGVTKYFGGHIDKDGVVTIDNSSKLGKKPITSAKILELCKNVGDTIAEGCNVEQCYFSLVSGDNAFTVPLNWNPGFYIRNFSKKMFYGDGTLNERNVKSRGEMLKDLSELDDVIYDKKTFKFIKKDGKLMGIALGLDILLGLKTKDNIDEVVAIVLHEIGHNFHHIYKGIYEHVAYDHATDVAGVAGSYSPFGNMLFGPLLLIFNVLGFIFGFNVDNILRSIGDKRKPNKRGMAIYRYAQDMIYVTLNNGLPASRDDMMRHYFSKKGTLDAIDRFEEVDRNLSDGEIENISLTLAKKYGIPDNELSGFTKFTGMILGMRESRSILGWVFRIIFGLIGDVITPFWMINKFLGEILADQRAGKTILQRGKESESFSDMFATMHGYSSSKFEARSYTSRVVDSEEFIDAITLITPSPIKSLYKVSFYTSMMKYVTFNGYPEDLSRIAQSYSIIKRELAHNKDLTKSQKREIMSEMHRLKGDYTSGRVKAINKASMFLKNKIKSDIMESIDDVIMDDDIIFDIMDSIDDKIDGKNTIPQIDHELKAIADSDAEQHENRTKNYGSIKTHARVAFGELFAKLKTITGEDAIFNKIFYRRK